MPMYIQNDKKVSFRTWRWMTFQCKCLKIKYLTCIFIHKYIYKYKLEKAFTITFKVLLSTQLTKQCIFILKRASTFFSYIKNLKQDLNITFLCTFYLNIRLLLVNGTILWQSETWIILIYWQVINYLMLYFNMKMYEIQINQNMQLAFCIHYYPFSYHFKSSWKCVLVQYRPTHIWERIVFMIGASENGVLFADNN